MSIGPGVCGQLIARQMDVEVDQIRLSLQGAHWLLQMRAELVDGRFGEVFARFYQGFSGERFS